MGYIFLIPARAGSTRVTDKNLAQVGNKSLVERAIASAMLASDILTPSGDPLNRNIFVSSNSEAILKVAYNAGAKTIMRPDSLSTATSLDISWVKHAIRATGILPNSCLVILRPTSPFRTENTILRAIKEWELVYNEVDSMRAVEKVKQHPNKMWEVNGYNGLLSPLLRNIRFEYDRSWNHPYQDLPEIYVQNACLEIVHAKTILGRHSLSGDVIAPFFTHGLEGFDINYPSDLEYANYLVEKGIAI